MGAAANVDEYLAGVASEDARLSLVQLRAMILEAGPELEETISYGIPTYKYHGMVASFGAFKKHCSFFPGHTVRDFAEELKSYKTDKGTVQFPHGSVLPRDLVTAMIRARMAENLGGAKT